MGHAYMHAQCLRSRHAGIACMDPRCQMGAREQLVSMLGQVAPFKPCMHAYMHADMTVHADMKVHAYARAWRTLPPSACA